MISKEEQTKLNAELRTACKRGELTLIKELIEKGAEVDAKDPANGMTPLHWVTLRGYLEVVKYLCEKGADVDAKNKWGSTPLHDAAGSVSVEMGLDMKPCSKLSVVKYLCVKGADVDARNSWGNTPLYVASFKGHLKVVKYLFLERNALMSIYGMFKYPELMKEKQEKVKEAQSIFEYFLQNKSKYKPYEIQEFKMKFLTFQMNEEDTQNLKSIVKFL